MEKIIVTRHKAVENYIRGTGLVPENTKCFPTVTPDFVKGKHIYGIVPYSIACKAELFTEVKVTLRKGVEPSELSLSKLKACIKEVRTYHVQEIEKQI